MTGTLIEVSTLSDMDRIRGELSDKSFWKVLMDKSSKSELVEALRCRQLVTARNLMNAHSQSKKVDIDELSDLYTWCHYILDHLGEERLHIPTFRHARDDPLHPFQPLPLQPTFQQLRDFLDLLIGCVEVCCSGRASASGQQGDVPGSFLECIGRWSRGLRRISHLEVLLDPLLEPRYCGHPEPDLRVLRKQCNENHKDASDLLLM